MEYIYEVRTHCIIKEESGAKLRAVGAFLVILTDVVEAFTGEGSLVLTAIGAAATATYVAGGVTTLVNSMVKQAVTKDYYKDLLNNTHGTAAQSTSNMSTLAMAQTKTMFENFEDILNEVEDQRAFNNIEWHMQVYGHLKKVSGFSKTLKNTLLKAVKTIDLIILKNRKTLYKPL